MGIGAGLIAFEDYLTEWQLRFMLKRISIKKLKIINDLSLYLDNLNVLVGANNSGKSSILQAIHFATSLAQSATFLEQPLDFGVRKKKCNVTLSAKQILYTPLYEIIKLGYNDALLNDKKGQIEIILELEDSSGVTQIGSITISKNKNETLLVSFEGKDVISKISDIQAPFSAYVPGLAGIAKTESLIARGLLLRAIARGDANLVLRNVLYYLNREKLKWESFCGSIQKVFPRTEFNISFKPDIDEHIEVSILKENISLPLELAGTGFLQTIQILTYIYLFEPSIVLLDEPDSHLHPNNQRALAALLADLVNEKTVQIVAATHSRHIIDTLRDSANRLWIHEGRLQPDTEHLDTLINLGALDSAEGLLAKGIKYVFLTEDQDKKPITTLILSLIDQTEFMVWSYRGCTNLQAAKITANFIREVSPTTVIIIHRDSDYFLDDEINNFRVKFGQINIKLFFTKGVDIERYFCSLNHLLELNPAYEKEVRAAMIKSLQECKDKFKEQAINVRWESRKLFQEEPSLMSLQECEQWCETLNFDEERWQHGKTLLKSLNRNFRELTNKNLKVYEPTAHIQDDLLKNLLKIK